VNFPLFVVNHTINATPPERLQHHLQYNFIDAVMTSYVADMKVKIYSRTQDNICIQAYSMLKCCKYFITSAHVQLCCRTFGFKNECWIDVC